MFKLHRARPFFLLPPQSSVGGAAKTPLFASPRPESQVYTLWRQGRRVHLQGSGMAWSSRRVVASLASCSLVQSRGHGSDSRGCHLACLMVQWLVILQQLLLGVHQGITQDLTHTQELALEWHRSRQCLLLCVRASLVMVNTMSKSSLRRERLIQLTLLYHCSSSRKSGQELNRQEPGGRS